MPLAIVFSASQLNTGEQPGFVVGSAGFSMAQRQLLRKSLSRSPELPQWRLVETGHVDAWIVNGASCALSGDTSLRISPSAADEQPLTIDMSDSTRPVAFAVPVSEQNIEPRCVFDLTQPGPLAEVLLDFDASLVQVHAQWLLGMQVVELGAEARHRVFHVTWRDKLLAIVDFRRGEAAIAADLLPIHVQNCQWSRRPDSAGEHPAGFVRSSPARLAWEYVRRSAREQLPDRYRNQTIFYRSRPRVPAGWLTDLQLLLLRELGGRPQTMAALCAELKHPAAVLVRELACLYYGGAITTTSTKATQAGAGDSSGGSASDSLQSSPASGGGGNSARGFRSEATVPAALKSATRSG